MLSKIYTLLRGIPQWNDKIALNKILNQNSDEESPKCIERLQTILHSLQSEWARKLKEI